MLGRLVSAMVTRSVAKSVGGGIGGPAGMALGYALTSRRLRVPALAGAAALAAWKYYQAKQTGGGVKPRKFPS